MSKKNQKSRFHDEEDIEVVEEEAGAEDKIKKVKKELQRCRKEKQEYLDGWQRAKADYINFKKEEEGKRGELLKFAAEGAIKEILALSDSFEAALKEAKGKDGDWQKGLLAIYEQFLSILKTQSVEIIESTNKAFDPQEHEAIDMIETDNKEEDQVIVEELQKGFKINGKVLRPAKVRVKIYKNKKEIIS